jgi:GT2 family glycosyltransferase
MADSNLVGIVTVLYKSQQYLHEFFSCLYAQDYPTFRLYVVDNASPDDSLALSRDLADERCQIISNVSNLGIAEANNQGVLRALDDGCEYILLLNNDVHFEAGLLRGLVNAVQENAASCAVTPKIFYSDEPARIWMAGGSFHPRLGYKVSHQGMDEIDVGRYDNSAVITYAPTCCVLFTADIFDRIGLMDPKYFVYFDDVDFMYRMGRVGIPLLYRPSLRLWHKVGGSSGGSSSSFADKMSARNRAYFIKKHLPQTERMFWSIMYIMYYFVRFLSRKDTAGQLKLKVLSWIEGLRLKVEPEIYLS